ncbi:deoxycytidylate deaminase [Ananas comosus]|uniref:dCMP deaminase n=1 Tax=Ananas comosus TaxID=4615 RepID=A0A6P5EPF9_ANACO|nr:deoxycytidylate deaminase [Ananas comosus]XP_020085395.1 deoxycytidylate deaminase [Ananas comosus]XP_020085403.1 deoxycytidylate deaminase [Ananas comosus]
MNPRDVALASASAAIGALAASVVAYRFFASSNPNPNPKNPPLSSPSTPNGSRNRSPFDPSKRIGYLSWDDYFMAIAFLSAKRSKDPNRQVGACLVSQDGIILGIGYNGFPRGCSDDKLPWAKKSVKGDPLETKYPYVVHAEVNAILNRNHASAAGQKLYVTMFPCNECAKIIIQSGVSEVIYFVEKRLGNSDVAYVASHKLLSMAGIKVRKHQPQMSQIIIKFQEP